MQRTLRTCAASLVAVLAAPIIAGAQPHPPPAPPSDWAQPAPPAPPAPQKPTAPPPPRLGAGPAVAGTWAGPVTQVGGTSKYSVVMSLTATGGQSSYPELNCIGKLTRIGASRSYAFFIEVIVQGQRDRGGRCPDGTITVTRSGDNLAWEWFGNVDGDIVLAYGTLTPKAGR